MDGRVSPEGVVRAINEKDQVMKDLGSFLEVFYFYSKLVRCIVSKNNTIL